MLRLSGLNGSTLASLASSPPKVFISTPLVIDMRLEAQVQGHSNQT